MPNGEEPKPSTSGLGHMKMAMPMFGHMEPFVVGENFDEYENRLQQFFIVNDVEESKKVPVLVTMAGPSLYSMASRICSPDDPCSKSYKDLIKLLKQHLAPKVNVVAERYKYRKCEQAIGQTITEFIIELKASSQSCDFGTFLQQALRDQFVAGEIGRSWEAAEHECKEMQGASKLATLKPRTAWKPSEKMPAKQNRNGPTHAGSKPSSERDKNCFRCGRAHNPESCPAKQWTCYACGKVGHVSSLCRSKNKKKLVAELVDATEQMNLNQLKDADDTSKPTTCQNEKFTSTICSASGASSTRTDVPATMELQIEGVMVCFEVDTGACESVISRETYEEKLSHMQLRKTTKVFQTVSGQTIRPIGELLVQVRNRYHHARMEKTGKSQFFVY
ncbi:uncharacterized protein LOC120906236 [Anopheles arabiensis]|uniref:uncharacterized protein LOC120906236 n=1 Tax=Anopheles arabiensis TaxID=7173 RepID=UPI001AADEEE9|nr:uncharacterized protein LOC120906236 [Anopheles arabiensis]